MKRSLLILLILLFASTASACGETTTSATTQTTATTTLTTLQSTEPATTTEAPSIMDVVIGLANPYNVALFMNEDPAHFVNVNFELPSADEGIVEWRRASAPGVIETVPCVRKTTAIGTKTVYTFAGTIGPLNAGETYEYRVGNSAGTSMDLWRTYVAPVDPETSFSFAVFADPQENDQLGYMAFAHAAMSVRAISETTWAFGLFVGDVVNDHEIRNQWNWFLRYASCFAVEIPIAATIGNHEHGALSGERVMQMEYDAFMNLPSNGPTYQAFDELDGDDRPENVDRGKTYSFDYGSAHFVAIDTELFCDGTTACADYDETNAGLLVDWLEADLASSEAAWTIIFLHRGPYSLSYDSASVRNLLVPVFEAYGVDLVLSGHDHQYSRSVYQAGSAVVFHRSDDYPLGTVSLLGSGDGLNFNEYASSIGTTYLAGNSAGTKFYGDSSQSGLFMQYEFRLDQPVIPVVTVTPDAIVVVSYYLAKTSPVDIVPAGVGVLERFRITHGD